VMVHDIMMGMPFLSVDLWSLYPSIHGQASPVVFG